ncbi:MAG: Kynurenine 3-monooxygenase [Chloroflexi bacterium]|nr:Kynurenine 3-monooxygenase [Chloroflexota bacterium]
MKFEVAIIGASTAGLYAAQQLASAGKHVALFESRAHLDPHRRTYIITSGLERVLGEIPSSLILHRITTMAVEGDSAGTDIPLKEPDLILERNQLTSYLAKKAREAGVEIFLGHTFKGYKTQAGKTHLQFMTEEGKRTLIEAESLLGADGVNSTVAQQARIPFPVSEPLLQAEVALPADWDPAVTKVWFDTRDTRYFYWLIPESGQRAVVGLIGEDQKPIRPLLDNFLAEHDLRPLKYQAGRAAMHHPRLRPWGEVGNMPVYLVGDAAGQVKVTTVGGTVTGFWGAKAAVRSLLGETSYQRELRPLKRELDMHWYIRSLLERLDNPGYDRLVRCITPAVGRFLARYDRDQMAKNFWKLAFVQPRFIPLGLGLLLSAPNHDPLPPSA